jgi:hypothetical protein
VLIHAGQVIDVSDCRDDAIAAGYKSLGNTPFLVKQVLAVEVPENLVSNQLAI